jgi:queuosine precursor transporter
VKKWIWGPLYLLSILLGNAFVIWFGIVTIAGLTFPAGVVWIGLTFSFRDFVQRYWGDWATWIWMIAASIITYFFNIDIALASMTAFLVSESLDWFVFKVLKRPFVSRLIWSNLISCPVDSLVFVLLAFGPVWPAIIGQAIIKYLSGLLVLPFLISRQKPTTVAAS